MNSTRGVRTHRQRVTQRCVDGSPLRMGCSSSRAAQAHTESEREIAAREVGVVVDEPLLLRLVSACNLPAMDLASESDVYCNARLLASGTSNKAITTAKWPVRWDSSDPLWDSCRLFGQVKPNRTDRLELHFMDCDEAPLDSDDHIGASFALILPRPLGTSLSLRAALTLCSHPCARRHSVLHDRSAGCR